MNIDVLKDLSPAEPASAGDLPPFGLFAAGVYPFLEFRWFHEAYYRVLEAFAAGRVRRLIVTMPPQHGKSGLRPCCPPTCWGAIPICGSPSPPIRLRWLRSSTGACSVSSIRPNMRPFSRKRPSSGEPGLRSTCVRLMRWRSSVTGAACSLSAARGRSRATVWTASFSTTFTENNQNCRKLTNERKNLPCF
jgi:hypothetical protein